MLAEHFNFTIADAIAVAAAIIGPGIATALVLLAMGLNDRWSQNKRQDSRSKSQNREGHDDS